MREEGAVPGRTKELAEEWARRSSELMTQESDEYAAELLRVIEQAQEPSPESSPFPYSRILRPRPIESPTAPPVRGWCSEVNRYPPYLWASPPSERGLANGSLTAKSTADAATGIAETFALTYNGDPTARHVLNVFIQNSQAHIGDFAQAPTGVTSLRAEASLSVQGALLRMTGPIFGPYPPPIGLGAWMVLMFEVSAWSPGWPDLKRSGVVWASVALLGTSVVSDYPDTQMTAGLEADVIPYQDIFVGATMSAAVGAFDDTNVWGLSWAWNWQVQSIKLSFCP